MASQPTSSYLTWMSSRPPAEPGESGVSGSVRGGELLKLEIVFDKVD